MARWLGFASYEDAIGRLRAVASSRAVERYEETVMTAARSIQRGDIVEVLQARLRRDIDAVGAARSGGFSVEYFQYLALIVLEAYIYRYFITPESLREDLRAASDAGLSALGIDARGQSLALNRVAFWAATGSGKTLLTHVNIRQYWRYSTEQSRVVDATILITPNEGLSRQHLRELTKSGIPGRLYQRDAQPTLSIGPVVEIIDIHKLRHRSGDTTVDVSTFAGNNLILIDEAHRGATGDEWIKLRSAVASGGFTMEYSATFAQAVAASKKMELFVDYSRSVVFEYSYGRFHEDGYGKDYDILNVTAIPTPDRYRSYFVGALLVYLSQCVAFLAAGATTRRFNIARPLMLLAGTRVNALVDDGTGATSDLLTYIRFLAWLVRGDGVLPVIEAVLSGASQITDGTEDVFRRRLDYLRGQETDPGRVYARLLQLVFNCAAPGELVVRRNGDTGELTLSAGESTPFGLITIGDDGKFFKLCGDEAGIRTEEDSIGTRLFDQLESAASTVTIVLGAKKFIEGWDTLRVSTMAFANIGRSEGSEVIQLFGRGVRLRGYGGTMRRSAALGDLQAPREIPLLETLSIFGLRADYLAEFRAILQEEQVTATITVPISVRTASCADAPYPRQEFETSEQPVELLPVPIGFKRNRVTVSYYSVARVLSSAVEKGSDSALLSVVFNRERLSQIDVRRLAYRLLRSLDGVLKIEKPLLVSELERLLLDSSWYSITIPDAVAPDARQWEEIAFELLRSYCRDLARRRDIERVRGKISFLDLGDAFKGPFVHTLEGERHDSDALEHIREALSVPGRHAPVEGIRIVEYDFLVSSPLLHGGRFNVRPASLNDGEVRFLDDLAAYIDAESDRRLSGWSVHVLRNDVGKGGTAMSTGEGRFFPDFLLWFERGGRYRLALVDPKGLGRLGTLDDAKVTFIKMLEDVPPSKRLDVLTGAIVSVTRRTELAWAAKITASQFTEHGVLFQIDDGPRRYIEQLVDRLQIPVVSSEVPRRSLR